MKSRSSPARRNYLRQTINETYMPPKALAFRAGQLAHFSGEAHRPVHGQEGGRLDFRLRTAGFAPSSDEAANVREWRRSHDRATRVPTRLVEKLQRDCAPCPRGLARGAGATPNSGGFKPHFQKVLDLNLQMAECWGFPGIALDALLEGYEPGVRASQLAGAVCRIASGHRRDSRAGSGAVGCGAAKDLLHGNYPVAAQQALQSPSRRQAIGFDFKAGRVDTTTHPFCNGLGPGDCRLTTRYKEQDFTQSLYGILHEAGHGLYEQGLPKEHYGTPLGNARLARHPRVAIAPLGKSRRPRRGVLGALASRWPAGISRN